MRICLSFAGLWLLMIPSLLLAGTTGRVTGLISSSENGEAIAGANVVLMNTTLGAAADINGTYLVTNVPAGTYNLRVSSMGYKTIEVSDVVIHADLQASYNFQMDISAIEGEVVTIVAERPLVEIDKTSSVQIVDSYELQELPVRGYTEIIKIQSGVQSYNYNSATSGRSYNENTNGPRLSIRGSRADEIMFNVDGVSLNDPFSGLITMRVPDLAWNEFTFLKGNFSSEYGRFMSGVVNWTMNTGKEDYHFDAEMTTDQIADEEHSYEQNKVGFALSGPFIPGNNKYKFFTAYEHGDYGDRSPSWIDRGVKEGNSSAWDSFYGKITTNLTDNIRFDLGVLYSIDEWNEFRQSWIYNTEHLPYYEDKNSVYYARMNHAVSADLNYTLTYNYTEISRFRGDNTYRKNIWDYGTGLKDDYDASLLYHIPGGEYESYMNRNTSYHGLRADVSKMIGSDHDIRAGFETQIYSLRYYENLDPNLFILGSDGEFSPAALKNINNFGYDIYGDESDAGGEIGRASCRERV